MTVETSQGEVEPAGGEAHQNIKFSRDAALSRILAPHLLKQEQLQLTGASFREKATLFWFFDEVLQLVLLQQMLSLREQFLPAGQACPRAAGAAMDGRKTSCNSSCCLFQKECLWCSCFTQACEFFCNKQYCIPTSRDVPRHLWRSLSRRCCDRRCLVRICKRSPNKLSLLSLLFEFVPDNSMKNTVQVNIQSSHLALVSSY